MVQKRHRLLLFSEGQRIKKAIGIRANFVARADKFCCPWFFTPLPVVFHAVARGFSRRRPWLFRPIPTEAKNLRKN